VDNTFDVGQGATNNVATLALQPDGKLFVGGGFYTLNSVTVNMVARLNVMEPPTFVETDLTAAVVDSYYVSPVPAIGHRQPGNFFLIDGELPPALALYRSTGQIYGTPTTAGEYAFTLIAHNWVAPSVTQEITLEVVYRNYLPLVLRD
jgi:hypothetical protein